jgi:Fe-S cluster assembly protein SufD
MMRTGEGPNWLNTIRGEARRRFDAMAWPVTTEEEWRRSDVSKLGLDEVARSGFSSSAGGYSTETAVSAELAAPLLERGARFYSLEEAAFDQGKILQALLSSSLARAADRFAVWSLAALEHASLLWIPPGLEWDEPILVETRAFGALSTPRLMIVVGEGARVDVVHRVTGESGLGLVNSSLDLHLGDGARLGLYELQDLPASTLYFRDGSGLVGGRANLRHFDAEIGGRFVKSRIDCAIRGEGVELRLDGAYHCERGQHMDLRTVQRHDSPRGTSRALYKGAVEGGGRTVFQGLIEVAVGASGTDAFLTNKNLLLGDTARSDSIPTLRIGNNDVRCSHGSTTGRLSDEELFYLETRGLGRDEARELILIGYFEELLGDTPETFREDCLARIRSRVGAPARAA